VHREWGAQASCCRGIALAALGMLYGLYYAVLVEHQMLDQMGGALATAFRERRRGKYAEAHAAVGPIAR